MKRIFLSLVFVCYISANAQAVELASLAPKDTVLALGVTAGDSVDMTDVRAALEELGWDEAQTTLQKVTDFALETGLIEELGFDYGVTSALETLLTNLSEGGEERSVSEQINELLLGFSDGYFSLADLCKPIADMDLEDFNIVGDEALLSIAINSYSPIPSITALSRFSEEQHELIQDVQTEIINCVRDGAGDDAVVELEQDDITFYVVGDGGDMPVLIGNVDDVFFIGSNPEVIRSVIRLSQGADEASYADSELFQSQARFTEGQGISIAVDFDAIADVAENFSFFIVEDDITEYLFNRAIDVLRTLNKNSSQIIITEEGIVSDSSLLINAEGGDEALAALALCDDCYTSIPEFLPAHSVSASAQYFGLEPFLDYIQGWLDGVEPLIDEDLNIEALANEYGFDLDALIFDWVGDNLASTQFEAAGSSMASWLYNARGALLVEVKNQEAADAGLEAWADIAPQFYELLNEFDDMDDDVMLAAYEIAHEARNYRGYEIDRYRSSFNIDISLFYVENEDDTYLVIASPFDAAEEFIDALEDGNSLSDNAGYQQLSDVAPDNNNSIAFSDVQSNIQYLVDLKQVSSQPIATLFNMGLKYMHQEYISFNGDYDVDGYNEFRSYSYFDRDVYSLETESIDIVEGETIEGTLAASEEVSDDSDAMTEESSIYYLLDTSDVEDGETVIIELESNAFDTYLQLLNADTGSIIDINDDAPDTSRSEITFEPIADTRYLIEVSAYDNYGGGDYSLTVNTQDMTSMDDSSNINAFDFAASVQIDIPEINNSLALGDSDIGNIGGIFYTLESLPVGEVVNVSVIAAEMDTYLRLVNTDTGEIIAENDDFDGEYNKSVISFIPEEDISYAIQVSSFGTSPNGNEYEVSFANGEVVEDVTGAETGPMGNFGLVELPEEDTWREIAINDGVEGRVTQSDRDDSNSIKTIAYFYTLEGIEAGDQVDISLESDSFDTRLYVIEEQIGDYMYENDDYASSSNSFVSFTAQEDESYIIEVTSFYGDAEGDYTLDVTITSAEEIAENAATEEATTEDEAFTLPTFAEWLNITDLGYETLEIIAERLSFSNGYSTIEDNTVFNHSIIHFDW